MSTPLRAHPRDARQTAELPPQVPVGPSPGEPIELRHVWYFPVKAVIDFLAALVLLVLSTPVIILAAVLIKLTSHGPVFYLQTRLGKNGRRFTLYKLRSMVNDAERFTGPVWAEADDSRTTPTGRFLRNAHIDELPQLVNVLSGHMSLIGPRPERPELIPDLAEELPGYNHRLRIRPGITGLAQLRLPPDSDLESVRRKLTYDLYYVQFASPWLDARLMFFTAIRIFVDACQAVWRLVALPHFATIERHVPVVLNADLNWDASGDGDGETVGCGELPATDSLSQPSFTKAR